MLIGAKAIQASMPSPLLYQALWYPSVKESGYPCCSEAVISKLPSTFASWHMTFNMFWSFFLG